MKVLVADDDKNLRKVLVQELLDEGVEVSEAENGRKTMTMLAQDEYDVLVLDLNMPGISGMEVLQKMKEQDISTEVVVLTAHATVSSAVEAMKTGAYDYLTKPFEIEELLVVLEKAHERKQLVNENLILKSQIMRQAASQRIVTESPVMKQLLETVRKFAESDLPVLIHGESGVGKELVARALHENSKRFDRPFVPLNCGAIPESMLETELFGHEKGAFTGAYTKKLGLLEIAHNGTLFLDEIGELGPQLQSKLLRVIETQTFFRVGGTKEVKVDVQFVSATNKDIKHEVETGQFRADLFYRISTLSLFIPPLRERKEDIPLLVDYFLKSNPAFKKKKLSKKSIAAFLRYPWPGNVRELQNILFRISLLTEQSVIDSKDLPSDIFAGRKTGGKRLADVEKEYILQVLHEADGQKRKAAEILGVDPKTLYRKLASYGIKD